MPASHKAPTRRVVFRKRETHGQRAKRMFHEHAITLGRVRTPTWEDASQPVREYWLQAARACEQAEECV